MSESERACCMVPLCWFDLVGVMLWVAPAGCRASGLAPLYVRGKLLLILASHPVHVLPAVSPPVNMYLAEVSRVYVRY